MNFFANKKIAWSVIFALMVVALSLSVKKKNIEAPAESPEVNQGKTIEIKDGTYSGDGYTVEVEKEKVSSPIAPNDLLDANRKISFSSDFSPEAQKILSDKIATVIANIKKDKTSFNDWVALGVNLKIAGDLDGARRAWEYVSAIYPTDYISPSNLGDLYHYYLKNYPLAEKNLLKAVDNNSKFVEGYKNLYDLYTLSYTEKKKLAVPILERGLKSNPDSVDLKNWISEAKKQ